MPSDGPMQLHIEPSAAPELINSHEWDPSELTMLRELSLIVEEDSPRSYVVDRDA